MFSNKSTLAAYQISELRIENDELRSQLAETRGIAGEREQEIKAWRKALWLNHGHDTLYGDDGEMQCPRCLLDFKRNSLDEILAAWELQARASFAEGK